MPRDGSGTYTRTNGDNTGSEVWQDDKADGVKIVASRHDTHDQDIADALTASIAKNGVTTPTADLPMGGFKHTGVGNGSARTHYPSIAQIQDGGVVSGSSAGAANAYTLTLSPAITSYGGFKRFQFVANHSNTGASTLNVNSVGARDIKSLSGAALIANQILSGMVVDVIDDGTQFILLNPHNAGTSSTPTPTTASGSLSSVTASILYTIEGKWATVQGSVAATLSGGPSASLGVPLPFTASVAGQILACTAISGGVIEPGTALLDSTTNIICRRVSSSSSFANGSVGVGFEGRIKLA